MGWVCCLPECMQASIQASNLNWWLPLYGDYFVVRVAASACSDAAIGDRLKICSPSCVAMQGGSFPVALVGQGECLRPGCGASDLPDC